MEKHPLNVEGFEGRLECLAREIGKMGDDKTPDFIGYLAEDIETQGYNDAARGRPLLSEGLYSVAKKLCGAQREMDSVRRECKPCSNVEGFRGGQKALQEK